MDSRWLGVIVLIIIVALGAWYVFSHPTSPATTPPVTEQPAPAGQTASTTPSPASATVPAPVTVTYTDHGFSPASVTITQGQTVTWVNQSSDEMWVASNPHPTHQGYDGTTKDVHCATGYTGPAPLDECAAVNAGGSWSFTFDKSGTWGYHNHGSAANKGTVVVTAAPAAPGDKGGVTASTSVNVL